jgi:hypothetical protein
MDGMCINNMQTLNLRDECEEEIYALIRSGMFTEEENWHFYISK